MKILAIESSGITASCAVSIDDKILGEYTLGHKRTHSEKLMPLIERLLSDLEMDVHDIEGIALSEGPGSYTGLRIGAAIGKGLAYSLNIPIMAVPTLMSLAANIYDTCKYIVPVIDARAGRVYSGVYRWENGILTAVKEQFPANVDELTEMINEFKEPVILNGDGAFTYRKMFEDMLDIRPIFSPEYCSYLKASSLAALGYVMAKEERFVTVSEFSPKYLRLAQAERNIK